MTEYKIQLSMYGLVCERADIVVNADNEKEAEIKALNMCDEYNVKFTHDDECPDGWEYQVEVCEEVKQ